MRTIGTTGNANRELGFTIGLISFDATDHQVRQYIRDGFDIALKNSVAVGFHIDDSMLWSRLSSLNTPQNIE